MRPRSTEEKNIYRQYNKNAKIRKKIFFARGRKMADTARRFTRNHSCMAYITKEAGTYLRIGRYVKKKKNKQ